MPAIYKCILCCTRNCVCLPSYKRKTHLRIPLWNGWSYFWGDWFMSTPLQSFIMCRLTTSHWQSAVLLIIYVVDWKNQKVSKAKFPLLCRCLGDQANWMSVSTYSSIKRKIEIIWIFLSQTMLIILALRYQLQIMTSSIWRKDSHLPLEKRFMYLVFEGYQFYNLNDC